MRLYLYRANSEVVVYGVNKEKFSNDAFLVYPESSLGTDYYTCSWAPSTLETEFAVVATQDNTQVRLPKHTLYLVTSLWTRIWWSPIDFC